MDFGFILFDLGFVLPFKEARMSRPLPALFYSLILDLA